MPAYSEIPAPHSLSDAIECFWHSRQTSGLAVMHRVVPDGCTDLLFIQGREAPVLQVVGPMTRFQDVCLESGAEFIGVRFRAGMGAAHLDVPAGEIVDEVVDLECLWGAKGRRLREQLAEAKTVAARTVLLTQCLAASATSEPFSPVQRAIGMLERTGGRLSLHAVALQSGLSVRQFRRRCLDESGLPPKLLARILRFRYAWQRAEAEAGEQAGLAAECGYSDQSHMIAEFRQFSGWTPAQRTNWSTNVSPNPTSI